MGALDPDAIPENDRFETPLTLRVVALDRPDDGRRDAALTVADTDGNTLTLSIWTTHEVDVDWRVGHRYRLKNVRAKQWTSNGETHSLLSSTRDLTATDLGATTDSAVRLLVIGDTHIGYRHREAKPAWAHDSDGRAGFTNALSLARNLDVDAVVHAGDIFDHGVTQADALEATQALADLHADGIPFHYVVGNHDTKTGLAELDAFTTKTDVDHHLHRAPVPLSSDDLDVALYGIDHTNGRLDDVDLEATVSSYFGTNVLVPHQTPSPVDDDGDLLYSDGVDVRPLLDIDGASIDLVVTGHLHIPTQGMIRGTDVPALITGPTIPISTLDRDTTPCAWLVTITDDGIDITRYPLNE